MSVGAGHVSDEELVERSLAGGGDAFAALYERHRERVFRIAYRLVRNQADALDLCQDVFVKAFDALPTFKGQAKFSTWLTRVAWNTCVDHLRQAKVRQAGELDEGAVSSDLRVPERGGPSSPSEGLEREELAVAIDAALAQLSPEHRQVFLLHAAEGLKYEEIAEVAGCPMGTVMSRLHYARKRLRSLLSWLAKD